MRFVLKVVVALVIAAALIGAAVYLSARQSLPQLDGVLEVAGLSAPVEIIRDADAIPHIFAATKLDGLFGLGYVHAQDRLWQMEFQRRLGFGRLSEIFGRRALPQDRFLRTVGFGRAARAAWLGLAAPVKSEIDAYVAGVNAFLAAHRGRALPPEFRLLRVEPEPWEGPDVVVWQKMMAWELCTNYSFELLRHDIATRVGPTGLAELMPPYPDDGLSILKSQVSSLKSQGHTSLAFDFKLESSDLRLPADLRLETSTLRRPEAIGSNAWVVDGSLTASGRPLLANDPHLTARLPSLWYLAHIAARDYEAIGATMPGTPAVVLGRNRWIAWGATNVAADVQDLYWERLDPTGRFARFRGRWEPLEFIRETIAVRGRAPVQLDVRVSRHGPLVSDAINANNAEAEVPARRALPPLEPLALRWTALDPDDTTVAAIMRLSEARDWSEFRLALQDFVVPAQNFVYADTAGHIGYSAPGRIPVRAAGDGAQPSEGWTGASEWTGWIPFGELPHTYDPPEHAIIAANQRPMPVTYPHHLGLEWPEAYRAQRIAELLRGRDKLTPDHFSMIQADTVSLHARVLLPVLLERARPEDAADLQAVRLLREWDYDTRGTSAPAAIFEAWFLALTPTLVGDELGSVTTESYAGRFSYVTRFLLQLLGSGSPGGSGSPPSINRRTHRAWCDDTRTPQKETCEQAVTQALHDALRELTGRLGRDMTKWRWDAVHQAVFPHQGLSAVPGLRLLFSRSVPSGGDWSTVDVGAVAVERPYEQQSIASYRQILDLSPANDSRFADAIGQSGHPLSDRYDDALERWRAVKHVPMRLDRAAIERGAVGRLYLRPVGNPKVKSQNAKGH